MGCQSEIKIEEYVNHLKHVGRNCEECHEAMQLQDGHLPFGEAMMFTWVCVKCQQEDVVILQKDGTTLEPNP